MAQITNRTGVTAQDDTVRTEHIVPFVRSYPYEPSIMMQLAHVEPAPLGSVQVKFPRYDQMSLPASALSETDNNTQVALATSSGTATPAILRFSLIISDELKAARSYAPGSVPVEAIEQTMMAILARSDTDALSTVTSATQSTGAAADTPDMDWLDSAITAASTYPHFRRAGGMGMSCVILAPNQAQGVINSMKANASPLLAQSGFAGNAKVTTMSGFLFNYGGFPLYQTDGVANESSDRRNACIMPIGRGKAGIGIAEKELFRVEVNRGHSGAERASDWIDIASWMGYGLADATALVEVLSTDA